MTDARWFGELRSAAHEGESPRAWQRICRALDAMSEGFGRTQAIPYVNETLAGWSVEVRTAPWRWVRTLSSGEGTWRMSAARRVGVDGEMALGVQGDAPVREMLADVYACEELVGLDTLSVDSRLMVGDVVESPWLDGLRRLDVLGHRGTRLSSYLPELFEQTRGLRSLRISSYLYADEELAEAIAGLIALEEFEARFDRTNAESLPVRLLDSTTLRRLACVLRWSDPVPAGSFSALESLTFHALGCAGTWGEWDGWERLVELDVDPPNLRSYRPLELESPDMDALIEILSRASSLERLALPNLVAPQAQRLLELESVRRVRRLDVFGVPMKARAGEGVVEATGALEGLERLRLDDTNIDEVRAALLFERTPSLRVLDVRGKAKLRVKGARALSECEEVEVAMLQRVGLKVDGAEALAAGAFGQNVRALDVSANQLGAGGLEALFGREWPALEALWLGMNGTSNDMDADAMRVLAGWSGLPRLRFLSLVSSKMEGDALEELFGRGSFDAIEVLDVSGNTLTEDAVRSLVEAPWAKGIRALGLGFTKMTPEAIEALATPGVWDSLAYLYMPDKPHKAAHRLAFLDRLDSFPSLEIFDGGSAFREFTGRRKELSIAFSFAYTEFRGIAEMQRLHWLGERHEKNLGVTVTKT